MIDEYTIIHASPHHFIINVTSFSTVLPLSPKPVYISWTLPEIKYFRKIRLLPVLNPEFKTD